MNRAFYLSVPALCFSVLMAACNSPDSNRLSGPEKHALTVRDAWQPRGPEAVAVKAGYLVLENHSNETQIVTGASSTQYESVTLHRTTFKNSISRMESVSFVEVAAGERMVFEPGGLHLMLHGPTAALDVGDGYPLILHLESGANVSFIMRIVERNCAQCGVSGDGGHAAHGHHDH